MLPVSTLAPLSLFNPVVVFPAAPSSSSRSAALTLVSVAPFLVAPNAPSASLLNAGLTCSFKGLTILFIKALSTSPALAPRLTSAFVVASPCVPSAFLPAAADLASSSICFCTLARSSSVFMTIPILVAVASKLRWYSMLAPMLSRITLPTVPPCSPKDAYINLVSFCMSLSNALRPSAAATLA